MAVETEATGAPTRRLGLPATVALVVGGIVGTGIFSTPGSVAPYGWLSIPALVVVSIGSLLLASCFASLSRTTDVSGGPFVYAREGLGDFAGFLGAWTYWIQGWTGYATIAAAAAGYLQTLAGTGSGRGSTLVLSLIVVWVAVAVNVTGTRAVGAIAVVTTVIKIAALVAIAIVCLTAFHAGHLGHIQPHHGKAIAALPSACAVVLFAFLGMEGATVAAGRVRDPRRTVPIAVLGGVVLVAVLYLLVTIAAQGALPQAKLQASSAPFAAAVGAVLGASWPAKAVAVVAVISALGALTSFNLINAEMVVGAGRDRYFPRIVARRVGADGVPLAALLVNALLASALLALDAAGNALALFTTLALLSTFIYVFSYVLAICAQLSRAVSRRDRDSAPTAVQTTVAVLAVAFSIWMAGATGSKAVVDGTILVLVGIPLYAIARGRAASPPPG